MSNIDSIIERINNLMAIAENEASSDNEAQMAFERAQKLINEYRIEDWKTRPHPHEQANHRTWRERKQNHHLPSARLPCDHHRPS